MQYRLLILGIITSFAVFPRESCITKMENALAEIAKTKDVVYANYGHKFHLYLDHLLENKPKLKRNIAHLNESAESRLAKILGNNNPNDVKYLLENDLLKAAHSGGEAVIFRNPKNPTEAIKIWKESRLKDFELSTRALLTFEKRVEDTPKLRSYLAVSKIKERGKNFIVKEFSPNSVELRDVASNADALKAIEGLKRELSNSSDIINAKLLNALNRNPISDNLHWDPDKGKILLIDALGF